DHAQRVLRDNVANYTKEGGMWDALRLLGDNLIGGEGESWRRRRRAVQPLFHRERLAGLTSLMTESLAESLASWDEAAAKDQPIDLAHAMDRITIRLALKTICWAEVGEAEMEETSRVIAEAMRYIFLRMGTYFLPEWLPWPGKRAFHEGMASLD